MFALAVIKMGTKIILVATLSQRASDKTHSVSLSIRTAQCSVKFYLHTKTPQNASNEDLNHSHETCNFLSLFHSKMILEASQTR